MRVRMMAALVAMLAGPVLADEPEYLDDRSTPVAVIQSFYNAIDRKEYARAYSYYQDGQGAGDFATFAKGYEDTASVTVTTGNASGEGAAGSTYWTLPVGLDAVSADGKHSYFAGCYTLRLANPGIQAEPPFRPLHIVAGHLKTANGAGADDIPTDCQP